MVAPWQEHQYKVVVEFKKSNSGAHRVVLVTHNGANLPQQLYGRVDPGQWASFMADVDQLAREHPYTQRQNAKQCCGNLLSMVTFCVIGCGFFSPDGGDYNTWFGRINEVIAKHNPYFQAAGVNLSLQSVHRNYFIQMDIDPNRVAMGMPAAPPPMQYAPQQGYPPQQPGMPGMYPPQAGYPPQAPPAGYPPQKQ